MGNIADFKNIRYEQTGEIDSFKVHLWLRDDVMPPEIWPGKFSDMASLERNALHYESLERRRRLLKLFCQPLHWLRSRLKI